MRRPAHPEEYRMRRRSFFVLAGSLPLAGCVGMGYRPGGGGPASLAPGMRPGPGAGLPQVITPGSGRGVVMLAPLSGDNAARGQALVQAAKLALGDPPALALEVKDT